MDLENAKKVFEEYASHFVVKDNKVNVKVKHTRGVMKVAGYIASELHLSEDDVELAKMIGLLHDIGRFEQAIKYDNFDDYNTMDHAEYGVKILFKDGMIRKFIDTDEYDEIIKKRQHLHPIPNRKKGYFDRGRKDPADRGSHRWIQESS